MLDDAALALEEIEPEDKTGTEVLGARIALYITANKWHMAAAVASHLVKGRKIGSASTVLAGRQEKRMVEACGRRIL